MNIKQPTSARRTLIAAALTAVVAGPLSFGAAVAGNQDNGNAKATLTDNEVVADKVGWNDPTLADTAAHDGRVLLRQVKDVQTALQVGDVDGARHAIKAARDFAETLKPLMPYQVVSDAVSNPDGKVVASGADVAVDQMLPIYGDVTTVTAYAPTQAKADGHQAKAAPDSATPVGSDISAATVYLPVLYFQDQIELAGNALDQSPPDTGTATQAVNDALSSLTFSATDVHLLPGGGDQTG